MIEDVLKRNPEVLEDPQFLVLLWTLADFGMEFRVQYFFDVIESSLLELRSQIMFDIWDTLKANDIQVPHPQSDVFIKEVPPEEAVRFVDDRGER